MKKKYAKTLGGCFLALVLALVVCVGFILQMPAIAAETDETLVYTYDEWIAKVSPHWAEITEGTESDWTTAFIFIIWDQDRNPYYAYCNDLAIDTAEEAQYRIINLEDAAYYTEEQAQMLRTIMENGYWMDWTVENVEKLGEAAGIEYKEDEEGNVLDNGKLLPGEALCATQQAIWLYANSDSENVYISKTYEESEAYIDGEEYYNVTYGNEVDPELNQYTQSHLEAVIDYLADLAAESPTEATPEQIIFSDKYATDWTHISYKEDGGKYEATLRFALVGDPDNYSDIYLNATYNEQVILHKMNVGKPTDQLSYDSDKDIFTLTFETDTLDEKIDMELTGTQTVNPGVYLYMSEGDGYTSQNFIGKVDEATIAPINARFAIKTDYINTGLELTKVNNVGAPVPGCEFELWAEKDGVDIMIGIYTTDSDGKIVIDDKMDANWNYYFKEISAPDGYEINPDKHYIPQDGTVEVVNNYEVSSLTVRKEVEGVPTTQKFAFTIQLDMKSCLKDAVDHLINTFTPDEKVISWSAEEDEMIINIALKDGETYEITDIPAGANYTVTEPDGRNLMYAGVAEYAEGMSYTPDKNDVSGVIDDDVSVTFTNSLFVGKTSLSGKKYLDNKDTPSTVGFTFRLEQIEGPVKQAGFPKEVMNDRNGDFCFDELGYSVEGTYVYTLTEVSGTQGNKYDYDSTVYYVTIEVTKNNDGIQVSDPVVSVKAETTDPATGDTIVSDVPVAGNLAEFINTTREDDDNKPSDPSDDDNKPSDPSDDDNKPSDPSNGDNDSTKPSDNNSSNSSNDDNASAKPSDDNNSSSNSSDNDNASSSSSNNGNAGNGNNNTPNTGDTGSLFALGLASIISAAGLIWMNTAVKKRED